MPGVLLHAPIRQLEDELAHRRRVDPDDVSTRLDERLGRIGGDVQAPHVERGRHPGSWLLAEDVQQLAAGRPVVVDAVERGPDQPTRLHLGRCPALRQAEQLGLQGEVDRARGHVHGKGLGWQLVLAESDGERQGDAGRQAITVRGDPPLHHGRGKGQAGPVDPGHPEQAHDRPLASHGRGGPGPGAPGAGEVGGEGQDAVERLAQRGFENGSGLAHRGPVCAAGWPRGSRAEEE
ncbi:MAG: hypothetical protein H6Q36_1749, partial [Chloroflexi bacterium]|nr:hypothetical protein [Chloroflexota bacterium]